MTRYSSPLWSQKSFASSSLSSSDQPPERHRPGWERTEETETASRLERPLPYCRSRLSFALYGQRSSSPSSARKYLCCLTLAQGQKVVPVPVWGLSFLVVGCRGWWLVTAKMRNLLALRQIAQRTLSTASRRQFENKVPEKQKLFQEDNGIPVHLKGGVADALLYRATMMLTVGGTAYAIYQLAMASFPKKQD
ncbi:LOW QUALITY PROTEIN: uncharacterized protein LOC102750117 [Leptonychotes weddellii]|uniref:Cytochrome c oxidase subunit 7A2, mitochondrial n=1 Tax=Leptonychotes weddellii TaxID=9713 RepID=A0A2U3XEE3_LEPWE|nr:LOW QUALITY PROTEIN: uncharacterized protein LOC102750117 [Leptonychotes weddellii]